MNAAFAYGKSGAEDTLTSDIFGLLKYLPPRLLLWPFLQKAECFAEAGRYKLTEQIGEPSASARFFFWPRTTAGREPDILLMIANEKGGWSAITIEVKWYAGKHNLPEPAQSDSELQLSAGASKSSETETSDGDQLADYFRSLLANEMTIRTGRPLSGDLGRSAEIQMAECSACLRASTTKKFLIYLTDDDSPPRDDIEETLDSIKKSGQVDEWRGRMYWLGWRKLYEAAAALLIDAGNDSSDLQREILYDVLRLLDLRGIRPFDGWKSIHLDISSDIHDALFWHAYWFREIAAPTVRFDAGSYFWHEP
jgi:hypothetical protein